MQFEIRYDIEEFQVNGGIVWIFSNNLIWEGYCSLVVFYNPGKEMGFSYSIWYILQSIWTFNIVFITHSQICVEVSENVVDATIECAIYKVLMCSQKFLILKSLFEAHEMIF